MIVSPEKLAIKNLGRYYLNYDELPMIALSGLYSFKVISVVSHLAHDKLQCCKSAKG